MSSVTTELPIITVTEAARTTVLGMRAGEPDAEGLALRIDVTGIGEGGARDTLEQGRTG